jgi:hypothetical protein
MSEIKVNKLSPRTNCGTVQLGDSGDTITIPAGATITNNGTAAGFGATGAASWDTTVKTSGFTAVSGVGYFVNTTSGAITVTLPASPAAGAVVAVKDYANTFDTNNLTLARNGSNIGGAATDAILSIEGLAITLVYVDATQGWLVTDSGLQNEAPEPPAYVTATGGTITCCGDYKIHTFTGPGTFCVSCAGNTCGSNTVDYLVVAGGGSTGNDSSGGGGAGGYRESSGAASGCYSRSPLGACVSAIPVSVQGYPIAVGGGGPGPGENPGSNSSALGITSTGGGYGSGNSPNGDDSGGPGGSGGAARGNSIACTTGGSGNTPPVSPPQGNNGGSALGSGVPGSAGGGGATQAGTNASAPAGGPGGDGAQTSISGSATYYAGGGGGSTDNSSPPFGAGGLGGGGNGGPNCVATSGTANTGGGGGGSRNCGTSGGSGIVIIRYKFQ